MARSVFHQRHPKSSSHNKVRETNERKEINDSVTYEEMERVSKMRLLIRVEFQMDP